MQLSSEFHVVFFFRYVVCKGLRENSQAVHEFMFNVNVRINKLKKEDILDVVEVGGEFLTWVFLSWWQYKALYLKMWCGMNELDHGILSLLKQQIEMWWSSSFIKYLLSLSMMLFTQLNASGSLKDVIVCVKAWDHLHLYMPVWIAVNNSGVNFFFHAFILMWHLKK